MGDVERAVRGMSRDGSPEDIQNLHAHLLACCKGILGIQGAANAEVIHRGFALAWGASRILGEPSLRDAWERMLLVAVEVLLEDLI